MPTLPVPFHSAAHHFTELIHSFPSNWCICSLEESCLHYTQRTTMANRSKESAQRSRSPSPSAEEVIESQDELLNSEHEDDLEVSFHPCHVQATPSNPVGQPPIATGMYMPYIEGPHMDWTVNDNLYHRLLKWHLKCENILEC